MTVVSNGQFWIYTFALLIFWIIVLTTASKNESNIKNKVSLPQSNAQDELKNTENCKKLCKQCGCLGFYCGEECICECNNDNSDTECIRQIQINAQNLNIPFEILIQGPTANNFLRNALKFELNQDRKLYAYRNKRSTVTVYKPSKENVHYKTSGEGKTSIGGINRKNRHRRSNNHFEWFSDLRNNLLRPAPLGYHKCSAEERTVAPKSSTDSSIFDNSWIFDSTTYILTPKPLNKLGSFKTSNENNINSSIETINPQTYQDVYNESNDNFGNSHKKNTNYNDEMEIKKIHHKNSSLLPGKKREESQENFISSLYSRLFKNDFNRGDDNFSFLPEDKYQENSQETHTNGQHSRLYKDDFGEIVDYKDLFSEEAEEESKKPKNLQESQTDDLTTAQVSSSKNAKKGLRHFRIPWLKPGKLLEKFKRVISS